MKIKCSQCFKMITQSESDNCEICNKTFCLECLTYYGEKSELAFCGKCENKH